MFKHVGQTHKRHLVDQDIVVEHGQEILRAPRHIRRHPGAHGICLVAGHAQVVRRQILRHHVQLTTRLWLGQEFELLRIIVPLDLLSEVLRLLMQETA